VGRSRRGARGLPFVLYAAWVAIALWDLVRREDLADRRRFAWTVVLLLPFLGPVVYLVAGRSPIARNVRLYLVFGAMAIYLARPWSGQKTMGCVLSGSDTLRRWAAARAHAHGSAPWSTTRTGNDGARHRPGRDGLPRTRSFVVRIAGKEG